MEQVRKKTFFFNSKKIGMTQGLSGLFLLVFTFTVITIK